MGKMKANTGVQLVKESHSILLLGVASAFLSYGVCDVHVNLKPSLLPKYRPGGPRFPGRGFSTCGEAAVEGG